LYRQVRTRRPTGKRAPPQVVRVLAFSASASRGFVTLGALRFACALGRGGCRAAKREGDGATPMGRWRIGAIHYRPDRLRRPRTALPVRAMGPMDGWCDAPADRNYNRFVRHPYPASAERLWRADALYDVVAMLSHNARPRVRGRGSAIFMHVARAGYAPTEGCIALACEDLLILVGLLRPGAVVQIGSRNKKRPELSRRAFMSTYRGSGVLE
jgi:L,D-peptidoglycan transpeptidase YkuD (ErfK/YbiS/YcfS/YnhG family)